jgi:L-threonylcarbamoyladenylate synthase
MNEEINTTLAALNRGEIILYPTDTVWGLGCDALNENAVKKIYKLKRREDSKSCILLLDDINKLWDYVREVPDVALDILEINDSPLTIIYPDAYNLPSGLIAEDGSIGIRITSDLFCKRLINKLKSPLVSTSANVSGQPTPKGFGDISEEIKNGVDYIVNLKKELKSSNNKSSGIIKVGKGGEVKVIRE